MYSGRNSILILFFFLFFSIAPVYLSAQKFSRIQHFQDLSRPEKWWVISHPFSATKAFEITRFVRNVTDSIKKEGIFDGDEKGGQLDAFKHTYWMALLTQNLNHRKAYRLGYDHEKGNKLDFRKNAQKTEKWLPTDSDCTMDMFNNEAGILIGQENPFASEMQIMEIVISKLHEGDLIIIYKDEEGNLLDCDGKIIDRENYLHQWEVPACLIPSSYNSKTGFDTIN
jgi:hypothetical protein